MPFWLESTSARLPYKVVLKVLKKASNLFHVSAKQVNPDSRENKKTTTQTHRTLQENYWNEWGTKTRPKTYSILSYPTDTKTPLSYTELATEGQGAEVAGQI